jgi:hypothetical protein
MTNVRSHLIPIHHPTHFVYYNNNSQDYVFVFDHQSNTSRILIDHLVDQFSTSIWLPIDHQVGQLINSNNITYKPLT